MNKTPLASWKLLIFSAILPIIVLVALNLSFGEGIHKESFKRFANALLTSYIVFGIVLLGNLFFYADSRHRPFAPLVGMFVAISFGILVVWALTSYQDLLLEANSGLRSQLLSNIVRLLVSMTGIVISLSIAIGLTFAMITGRERRILFEEE